MRLARIRNTLNRSVSGVMPGVRKGADRIRRGADVRLYRQSSGDKKEAPDDAGALLRLGRKSVTRNQRAIEVPVHANACNRSSVAQRRGACRTAKHDPVEKASRTITHLGDSRRIARSSEIIVKVLKLCAPIGRKHPLAACPGRPSNMRICKRSSAGAGTGSARASSRWRNQSGLNRRAAHAAIGKTSRTVQQERRSGQETKPAADRTQIVEMTGDRRAVDVRNARNPRESNGVGKNGASALAGPRYIGFKARYTPAIELPVVAELTAPDEAGAVSQTRVECRDGGKCTTGVSARDRGATPANSRKTGASNGTVSHAIAIRPDPACVQASIPAGPA